MKSMKKEEMNENGRKRSEGRRKSAAMTCGAAITSRKAEEAGGENRGIVGESSEETGRLALQ